MLRRRGFLGGMLAALAAPAIIRTPGLLMPVKPVWTYKEYALGYSIERVAVEDADFTTENMRVKCYERFEFGFTDQRVVVRLNGDRDLAAWLRALRHQQAQFA